MFFRAVFASNHSDVVVKLNCACFFKSLNFLNPSEELAKAIVFAWWPFSAILKMVSFFEYELLFSLHFFCTETLQCVVETFLACTFGFLIFDPK